MATSDQRYRWTHGQKDGQTAKAHGTRPKFSAQVSGTRNLGGELGSCAIRLTLRELPSNVIGNW